MNAFLNYLSEVLNLVIYNGRRLFHGDVDIRKDFTIYHQVFLAYSDSFGAEGWIFFILLIVLCISLVAAIVILVIAGVNKLLQYRKCSNVDARMAHEEISKLRLALYESEQEKSRILGIKSSGNVADKSSQVSANRSRFPKLTSIDEAYKSNPTAEYSDTDSINLEGICDDFRNFAACRLNLYYSINDVRAFIAGMGVTKFFILEGVSGVGKTSLPYAMGEFFSHPATICPIQPSWKDNTELLGYYNDFTGSFSETDFLASLYEANYRKDVSIIVLDEMNLSRVEYYFADLLSIMEMPDISKKPLRIISHGQNGDPVKLQDGCLPFPNNAYFVGTANNDDSTFTITDKVYDRGFVLKFKKRQEPFEAFEASPMQVTYGFLDGLFKQAIDTHPISEELTHRIKELENYLSDNFGLVIGNRVNHQIDLFIPCFKACGGDELEGFDYILSSKIIRKLQVLNMRRPESSIESLLAYVESLFGKGQMAMTEETINELRERN